MADKSASGQVPGEAPVLGRLADFPDGAATRVAYRKRGREAALVLVRRGSELRAYEDACPHQWLPLTYRGNRVLSEDRQRLRCTNHAAEFAVEDGRALCGPGDGTGLVPVSLRITPDGSVLIDS